MVNNFFKKFFSGKYANPKMGDNYLLMLMYRFANPFSVFLHRFGMTPNWITTWSLICSILAFIALSFDDGWSWFATLWAAAVLLDFCDGTVARMSNKVSKVAFRYDHMSDLFKISLIILGVGLRYDETIVWVLAFSACFALLYSDLLNRELHFVINRLPAEQAQKPKPSVRSGAVSYIGERLSKNRALYAVVKTFWVGLLTINGHTLLLFFAFPLSMEIAVWIFVYLTLICLFSIKSRIALLASIPR